MSLLTRLHQVFFQSVHLLLLISPRISNGGSAGGDARLEERPMQPDEKTHDDLRKEMNAVKVSVCSHHVLDTVSWPPMGGTVRPPDRRWAYSTWLAVGMVVVSTLSSSEIDTSRPHFVRRFRFLGYCWHVRRSYFTLPRVDRLHQVPGTYYYVPSCPASRPPEAFINTARWGTGRERNGEHRDKIALGWRRVDDALYSDY